MLYDIPNWPPYKVRGDDLQIVSFHPSHGKDGYELKRLKANCRYNRGEEGFNLYYLGNRGFISMSELRKIVKINKEKQMQHATDRYLKSGDYIIGSQLKSGGVVSFASNPAIHPHFAAAKAEAARLALLDKNKRFLVVDIKAVASAQDVVWE